MEICSDLQNSNMYMLVYWNLLRHSLFSYLVLTCVQTLFSHLYDAQRSCLQLKKNQMQASPLI